MSKSDIVQRLRELEAVESELACECDCPPEATANYQYAMTCAKAADEITRLRAEVKQAQMREACAADLAQEWEQHCKRAEAEVEKLKVNMRAQLADHINGTPCAEIRWQQERETLTARVEELEAALRLLACTCEAESQDECSRSEKHCPFWNARAALTKGEKKPAYTEGHCAHKKAPGGCQLHNLYCGYPDCDRRAAITQETRDE